VHITCWQQEKNFHLLHDKQHKANKRYMRSIVNSLTTTKRNRAATESTLQNQKGTHLITPLQSQLVLLFECLFFCPFGADFFLRFGKIECWWEGCHGWFGLWRQQWMEVGDEF
jgi:hypothetical protein